MGQHFLLVINILKKKNYIMLKRTWYRSVLPRKKVANLKKNEKFTIAFLLQQMALVFLIQKKLAQNI